MSICQLDQAIGYLDIILGMLVRLFLYEIHMWISTLTKTVHSLLWVGLIQSTEDLNKTKKLRGISAYLSVKLEHVFLQLSDWNKSWISNILDFWTETCTTGSSDSHTFRFELEPHHWLSQIPSLPTANLVTPQHS